ncbi:hypothetical protein QYE76_057952 [Lolium multiflorum]|uniref:TF-B3 domain-containing protein n=1 Tax=Lolium multiflorum TaxID=4521 RepID=A0AAD8T4K0_LOLMU|nr:hypothetical protein QYE76_057952 [Lolium multiflorum]
MPLSNLLGPRALVILTYGEKERGGVREVAPRVRSLSSSQLLARAETPRPFAGLRLVAGADEAASILRAEPCSLCAPSSALQGRPLLPDVSKMSNPCECCQTKLKFIRQINGNFMHSMVIPEWFVKYFGGKIPGTIKLEAANGNIYDVAVTESMNRKILQSGWAVFVDANKIEENYSLMFRYLGNARFKVTIFDSNGKEKSLCGAGMKTASDVKRTNNRYVDNANDSRDGTTKSSSGEGSDSDGCPKESSCHYCESQKTAGLSYTSEAFSG